MDLLDLWRGTISGRRIAVLIAQLPPGSRIGRAVGGYAAWSDEVAATYQQGHRIMAAVLGAAGVKQGKIPKPIEPPKIGWQAEAREKQAKQAAKAQRWIERNKAREAGA